MLIPPLKALVELVYLFFLWVKVQVMVGIEVVEVVEQAEILTPIILVVQVAAEAVAVATLATLAVRGGGGYWRSSQSSYIQLRTGHAGFYSTNHSRISRRAGHHFLESSVAARPAGSGRTHLSFPV
jgi:hypothetical protein